MLTTSSSIINKLLLLFLVIAGLLLAKELLMPLAIAGVLATLFLPFSNWMERRRVPRVLSAVICLMILLLFLAGIGALLGWQVSELTSDFSLVKQRIIDMVDRVQAFIVKNTGISIKKQTKILSSQEPLITDILQWTAGSLTSIFTYFVFIMVYLLFLIYYRSHIKLFMLKLSSPAQRDEMDKVIYRVAHVSQQYLLGLSKMIVCLWIMYGVGFSILGIKNALFFAFLCGLLEIIPFIGNVTGTVITVLVAAVSGSSAFILVGIVITYGIIQFIQGWILEPLIVGSQVKINPLFTIIALVIGELIWGIPGIFLAIPVMAMFKILCDHIGPLNAYGFLIGETKNAKQKPVFLQKIIKWFQKKRE